MLTCHEARRTALGMALAHLDHDEARWAKIIETLDRDDLRHVAADLTAEWVETLRQSGPYHDDCLRERLAGYARHLAHLDEEGR